VIGSGQKFMTRAGQIFCFLGRVGVSHLCFGFGFVKFPLKIPNFSIFFPLGQKISSGWVKKYWGGLLFIAGQKYAWVGLG